MARFRTHRETVRFVIAAEWGNHTMTDNQLNDELFERMSERAAKYSWKNETERVRAVRNVVDNMEGHVTGMLRITELFEARRPSGRAIVTPWAGLVLGIEKSGLRSVIIKTQVEVDEHVVGQELAEEVTLEPGSRSGLEALPFGTTLTGRHLGQLRRSGIAWVFVIKGVLVPARGPLLVRAGEWVAVGDKLTPGPADMHEILASQGPAGLLEYMVREIQTVYKAQGVDIHDKHIEVIVRQMLRKCRVTSPGESGFAPGQIVDRQELNDINRAIRNRAAENEAASERILEPLRPMS